MAAVIFMGLSMDDTLQIRIMAAVKGVYASDLPTGTSDEAVMQHMVLLMVTDCLARWEGSQAGPDPAQAGRDAIAQALATQAAAVTQARTDAATISPTVVT